MNRVSALLLASLVLLALAPAVHAQQGPLEPHPLDPALWPLRVLEPGIELHEPQVSRPRDPSFLPMAGAATLGSVAGAGAGILLGMGASQNIAGTVIGYPGAWLGAAVGAELTGATRSRAFFGSTIGLFAGGAFLGWVGESWGVWPAVFAHGIVTAVLAGGVDGPEVERDRGLPAGRGESTFAPRR